MYRDGSDLKWNVDGAPATFANVSEVALAGEHNLSNVLPAALAAHIAGVSDADIRETLKTFAGLPGRQQVIGEVGCFYVNDTTATSRTGTIAALKHFGNSGNIILLAGGASKNFSLNRWVRL